MPVPDREKRAAFQLLAHYCVTKIPTRARDQIELEFRFEDNVVFLVEQRPDSQGLETWVSIDIARFRYFTSRGEWVLYCADRNGKWHRYDVVDEGAEFKRLLHEVDDDPTGIFWG
jgi:hypothetical protein